MTEQTRDAIIESFLSAEGITSPPAWLPVDASMRRYGRVDGAMLMDAPPHPTTKTAEYIAITRLLRDAGLSAAEIYAKDTENGLLLLQDLGSETFTHSLNDDARMAEQLYTLAYEAVEALQAHVTENPQVCPDFDTTALNKEFLLFKDWYCPAADIALSPAAWAAFDGLVETAHQQVNQLPQRFVLRDCHVDNFLYRPAQTGLDQCGVLDFQDGGWGSALYDVTSLLFDARRDVPSRLQAALMRRHAQFLQVDWAQYQQVASYLVLQRALKVLGIFVRLNVRDGKDQYLPHLARCWGHIDTACAHLTDWQAWFAAHIPAEKRAHTTLQPLYLVDTAMILAAGKGTRMGALGQQTPKPLLPIAGVPMILRTQATLQEQGISRFIVNAHHRHEKIEALFHEDMDTDVIPEKPLLETGGGVRHALPSIGREVFWVINGDSLWTGTQRNDLAFIEELFYTILQNTEFTAYHECGAMLLLLVPLQNWRGADPSPDFAFVAGDDGKIRRATDADAQVYGFSGVRLMNRAAIADEPMEHFSMNRVFDRLIDNGRLFGLAVDWTFYHVGDEAALELANNDFRETE